MQLQIVGDDFDLTWSINQEQNCLVGKVGEQSVNIDSPSSYYQDEIKGFVEAVKTHNQSLLRSPYQDACQSLAVCDAANQAIATGGFVVIS